MRRGPSLSCCVGDAGRAVLCCGLGGLVPPARAVLSAPACELWATGHAGGNRSLSGKSSAAPSWTRLSLVPITSGDLGAPSAQLNYLLCSSPVTGELRGRGLPTPFLLAWFSDDMDSVCHVCGYVVQEEPCDGATASRPGSPKLGRCPRLLAARPKTVLFLFLFRAGQSPLGSLSEAWSQREARTRPLVSPAACRERTQPSEGVPREMEKQTSSSSVAAWRAGCGRRGTRSKRAAACCAACGFEHAGREPAAPGAHAGHRQPRAASCPKAPTAALTSLRQPRSPDFPRHPESLRPQKAGG